MSMNPASPYSAALTRFPFYRQLISEFLPISDSVCALPTLNKEHTVFFKSQGVWVKELRTQNRFLPRLFENIGQQFSRLASLDLHFLYPSDDAGMLTNQPPCRTITRLTVLGMRADRDIYSKILKCVLERTTELAELSIKSEDTRIFCSRAIDMYPFDTIRANLKGLKKLDMDGPAIHGLTALQLLECSTEFVFINLSNQPITNAMFGEIAKSAESLKHLHLHQATARVDYGMLSNCTRLESFKAGRSMTADALISLILENPNLVDLNLSCSPYLPTDKVLNTIAKKLPKLRSLLLYVEDMGSHDQTKITDEGILSLIRNCRQLRKLYLGNPIQVSSNALLELGNCPFLEDLQYGGYKSTAITNDVFNVITSLTHLKYLRLCECQNVSEESFSRLRNLPDLKVLSLEGTIGSLGSLNFTDKVLSEMVPHCQELEVLHINSCRKITDTGLSFWLLAPKKLNKMREIHLIDANISSTVAMQFLDQYPRVKAYSFTSIVGGGAEFRDEW